MTNSARVCLPGNPMRITTTGASISLNNQRVCQETKKEREKKKRKTDQQKFLDLRSLLSPPTTLSKALEQVRNRCEQFANSGKTKKKKKFF